MNRTWQDRLFTSSGQEQAVEDRLFSYKKLLTLRSGNVFRAQLANKTIRVVLQPLQTNKIFFCICIASQLSDNLTHKIAKAALLAVIFLSDYFSS